MAAGRTDSDAPSRESPALCTKFYGYLRAFLLLSMLLLAVDVAAAHVQAWHSPPSPTCSLSEGHSATAYASSVRVRLERVAPALQFLTNECIVLFLIQSTERLILFLDCLWIGAIGLKGIKHVPKTGGSKGRTTSRPAPWSSQWCSCRFQCAARMRKRISTNNDKG